MKFCFRPIKLSRQKLFAAGVALASAVVGVFGAGFLNKSEAQALPVVKDSWKLNLFGAVSSDCPLEIESGRLIFDLADCKKESDETEEVIAGEKNADNEKRVDSVTEEYTIYNPTDSPVTTSLIFPYRLRSELRSEGERVVFINGEKANVKNRYSYPLAQYKFNFFETKRLRDGYDESGFFKRDLPVTRYVFKVSGIKEKADEYPYAALKISTKDNRKYAMQSTSYTANKRRVTVGRRVENGDLVKVDVYGYGADLTADDWIFCDSKEKVLRIKGKMKLEAVERTTFGDRVFKAYNEEKGVSRSDWFNAAIDYMNKEYLGKCDSLTRYVDDFSKSELFSSLNMWQECELTVPANGRVISRFTTPPLKRCNDFYSPDAYEYTYYTSFAKTWKKFGPLTVDVLTPNFIVEREGWTKTDYGYTRVYETLPDGELKIAVCEAEAPTYTERKINYDGIAAFTIAVVAFGYAGLFVGVGLIAEIVVLTVMLVKKIKRKKQKNKANKN